jgi:hypothetical protein
MLYGLVFATSPNPPQGSMAPDLSSAAHSPAHSGPRHILSSVKKAQVAAASRTAAACDFPVRLMSVRPRGNKHDGSTCTSGHPRRISGFVLHPAQLACSRTGDNHSVAMTGPCSCMVQMGARRRAMTAQDVVGQVHRCRYQRRRNCSERRHRRSRQPLSDRGDMTLDDSGSDGYARQVSCVDELVDRLVGSFRSLQKCVRQEVAGDGIAQGLDIGDPNVRPAQL